VANQVLQTYAPALYDAIGGTVVGMVDQVQAATSSFAQGDVEAGMDHLFGLPVPLRSGNDDSVAISMGLYEEDTSPC
jgi:hypothetical protein